MGKASKNAVTKYKEMTGRSVEVKLEEGLNDDEAGGVIGSSMGGKIKINNTLDERLKLLEEKVCVISRCVYGMEVLMGRCCPS
jgi:V-type H+-transporting ATPase subunit E